MTLLRCACFLFTLINAAPTCPHDDSGCSAAQRGLSAVLQETQSSESGKSASSASSRKTRRRKRWISWLGDETDGSSDELPSRSQDGRRFRLAWLSLQLQAKGFGREPLTATLYNMLEQLSEDKAVALLRMTSSAQGVVNYTSHLLDLASKHKMQLKGAGSLPSRRQNYASDLDAKPPSWLRARSVADWTRRLASVKSKHVQSSRFLAVRPRNGVGNRLLAVASAAALAVALNRSLVVLWEDPMFEDIISTAAVNAAALADLLSVSVSRNPVEVQMLNLVSGWSGFREAASRLACGSENKDYDISLWSENRAASVIFVESDQFFLPLLQLRAFSQSPSQCVTSSTRVDVGLSDTLPAHPTQSAHSKAAHVETSTCPASNAQTANATSAHISTDELAAVSSTLMRQLFRLSPATRAIVLEEAEQMFEGASFVVGVHVRTQMYDYEKDLVPEPEMEDVLGCIEAAVRDKVSPGKNKAKYVIFLATPSDAVKKQARKRFGARLKTRKVNTDRSSTAGEIDAVVDLALLSMSDALVTSVHSTFGYVAQSLADVAPYVLTDPKAPPVHGSDDDLVAPRCRRLRTSSPCFHAGSALLATASVQNSEPPLRCARERLRSVESFGPWAACRY
eukprot:TRINITY_DN47338_c0_g1_i1.p1 TRINITY_DN47338_c0_g1~~TRINITY_DN47338_c0_g1_i1.p1  ORF type:complete len:643 (-),score=72.64 TRINITY_DN47338_c0_g1_i1:327-2198(-)